MQDDKPSWLEVFIDRGGLPALLGGPGGKYILDAFGQLVGGLTAIPVAYLEKHAEHVRDETKARSRVMQDLSQAVSKRIGNDDEVLGRYERRWLNDGLRKQKNREHIANLTLDYLLDDPPKEIPGPVSFDFLNRLGSEADNASSTELQDMFSRILAGEIRSPGTFSLKTIQTISLLDKSSAEAVKAARPWFNSNNFIPTDTFGNGSAPSFTQGQPFHTLGLMVELGLLHGNPMEINLDRIEKHDGDDKFGRDILFRHGPRTFQATFQENVQRSFIITKLTTIGGEIMSLIPYEISDDDTRMLADAYQASCQHALWSTIDTPTAE